MFGVLALPPVAPVSAQPADDDVRQLERITVTGSRLLRTPLDGAYPITEITRAELLASGHASLGAFLQSLPFAAGSPLGTTTNQRGSGGGLSRGTETIELRGLGAQRTLVLVNGRRFVAGGNGTDGVVDLGAIPLALVQRVEVLKSGASVEYGADAVAGVVNVITRDRVDGADVRLAASQTDRGDGATLDVGAVAGADMGATQLQVGAAYLDQRAVGKGARDFSRRLLTVSGPDNAIVPDGSSAPPNGNFRTSDGRVTLIDGADGDSPDDFRPFISSGPATDRFNFNPFEDLRQDSRRMSLFATARQSLAGDTHVFGEASIQHRESDTRLAPLPFFTTRLDGVMVDADAAFNPFDEDISDARRRLVEAGPRRFVQDNRLWRVVVGAGGVWRGWTWDLAANHGRNSVEQTQTGDVLADRVALALGPGFRDNGRIICGSPQAPIADCVPLNLFGGPGSITPAMLGYVGAGDLTDRQDNRQTVITADLAGDVWAMPAGVASAALGYRWRQDVGRDLPDAATRAGNTSGAARAVTEGGFRTHAVYAELGLPLLRDAPWADALDAELGLRVVDDSTFDSETVWEAGVRYAPTASMVWRAAFSQVFRAPTVGEAFGGLAQSNPAIDDPCADFSQLEQAQIDRCVDQGVPADGRFDQTGNETPVLGGGNRALDAERGDVVTVGISWQPPRVPGLDLDLDYYDIRIDDAIAALGGNTILEQCLATGAARFCDNIDRDASGAITQVRSPLQNIASESARGVDLAVAYRQDTAYGGLAHDVLLSYVVERQRIAVPGAAPFVGVGTFDPDAFGAIPRWKGRYRADATRGPWQLAYTVHWIGPLDERGGELFPGTVNRVASRVYHDVTLGWDVPWGGRLQAGIYNLTDRDPPFLANSDVANTDVATYRLLGRTLQVALTHRW